MNFSPTQITFEAFERGVIPYKKQLHIDGGGEGISRFECFGHFVEGSRRLICLMPSALPGGKEKPDAVFHRWSWYAHLQDNVISISDPTFSIPEIYCGWFLGRGNIDLIKLVSDRVKRIASKLDVEAANIVFYGSSMGGFASMMMASMNKGALAIAEVPQFNLIDYPIKASIAAVEKYCLSNVSLQDFAIDNGHLVSVIERFVKERNIPNIKLITNPTDIEYGAAVAFMSSLPNLRDSFDYRGVVELCLLPDAIGHSPLPTAKAVRILREELQRSWDGGNTCEKAIHVTSTNNPATQVSSVVTAPRNYKEILDEAVECSKKIKYIRTESDRIIYERTLALLYEASEVNPKADWPLLKICSIEKQWTNSFNQKILDAAMAAMQRKETLEGFIYCCRGFLYNMKPASAMAHLEALIANTSNAQTANVGNIFLAILAYNNGEYEKYVGFISSFRLNKDSDFNPYIAIPVATVYTDNKFAPASFGVKDVSLAGMKIPVADIPTNKVKYVVSISCDSKYFSLYGEYLIKSFTKFCAAEAALHVSLLDGDRAFYSDKISEWGGQNVFYTVIGVATAENKGPIASMLRFMSVYPLMEACGVPVLVLDLDTVIKMPFADLVERMNAENVDLLSRILGGGVAPWEKYTGGFAFFNCTENSMTVARNIAYIGGALCRLDQSQWWIDQNVFEAAIRERLMCSAELKVENIFNVRDNYCVMPVGSAESKDYVLKRALESFVIN